MLPCKDFATIDPGYLRKIMDLDSIKADLTQLVLAGRKADALKLLQERYRVNETEAEDLLRLAVKESVNPAMILKTIGSRLGGRGMIFKLAAFGLGFMGVPIALVFAGLLVFDQIQVSNSISIQGVVTELETLSYEDARSRPVIQYTFDTELFHVKGSTYSSPPAFKIGDAVPLLIDSDYPENAVINTFSERWIAVTILGIIGVVFLGLMGFFIRLAANQRAADSRV